MEEIAFQLSLIYKTLHLALVMYIVHIFAPIFEALWNYLYGKFQAWQAMREAKKESEDKDED